MHAHFVNCSYTNSVGKMLLFLIRLILVRQCKPRYEPGAAVVRKHECNLCAT